MDAARAALKEHFGYDGFRPGQETLVRAVLSGRDCLGVMPTGAGKSICYQIPGVVLPGLTLVVSPLVSLMGDQVRALLDAGVRGSYLNSTLTPGQQGTVMRRALTGAYDIMYVAPERLADSRFIDFASQANIPLIAIDEAHCVSQWGQGFASLPGNRRIHRRPAEASHCCGAYSNSNRKGSRRHCFAVGFAQSRYGDYRV